MVFSTEGVHVGRRKKKAAEAAAAAAEAVEATLVEDTEEKKGSFLKKVLFLGVLAGIGFAVFKFRQSTM